MKLHHPFTHEALATFVIAGSLFATTAHALIMTGGNEPVRDHGWPTGAVAVANLPTRISWMEGPPFGGGQWTFFYRGSTDQFREALTKFAEIRAPKLEVVLHDGDGTNPISNRRGTPDDRFDWSFEIWVPESWNQLYNKEGSFIAAEQPQFGQPVAAPKLDVWLRPNGLQWDGLKVPTNVVVNDTRATSHGFPPGSGSVIRARVLDLETTQPIAGATLTASASERVVATNSSADGTALLSQIPDGNYQISVSATGYAPRLIEYARYGTNDFKEFTVKLAHAASLSGVVLDDKGQPLSGVNLRAQRTVTTDGRGYPLAQSAEATSDDKGHFELTGLPVGKTQIWANRDRYHHRWDPKELIEVKPPPAEQTLLTVRMVATGNLRVQLVDANGAPQSLKSAGEAHVHIQQADKYGVGSWGGSANLSTDGTYEFKNVPPGPYYISDKPFHHSEGQTVAPPILVKVEAGKTNEAKLPSARH